MQALCYFYRIPPPGSGVKPQPYKTITKLIRAPNMGIGRAKMAVRRFHVKRRTRDRKVGWRKTTPAEDAAILACFRRAASRWAPWLRLTACGKPCQRRYAAG